MHVDLTGYKEYTDQELILMLQNHENIKAFDELVFRYKDRIINFVYQHIKNRDDAEDITQDSFLRLYKYRNNYREIAKFSTWFFTITVNCIRKKYDHCRRKTLIRNNQECKFKGGSGFCNVSMQVGGDDRNIFSGSPFRFLIPGWASIRGFATKWQIRKKSIKLKMFH